MFFFGGGGRINYLSRKSVVVEMDEFGTNFNNLLITFNSVLHNIIIMQLLFVPARGVRFIVHPSTVGHHFLCQAVL